MSDETYGELCQSWAPAIMVPRPVWDWPGFRLRLAPGSFADLQPVNSPFWLFSTALRDLATGLSPTTPIEWLPLEVVSEDGKEERTYWTPSLLEDMDVYQDGCVTRSENGSIIYGYLDHDKADHYRLLAINHGDPVPRLYAHRELKKQAVAAARDRGVKWDTQPTVSWQEDRATWNQMRSD